MQQLPGSEIDSAQVPPAIDGNRRMWRPQSKRVGISPLRYVFWNFWYAVMEFLNRTLSRDPHRRVSWDKWPPYLGLLYLLAKIRFNRSNALTDPYDYASNDTMAPENEPEAAKHYYSADGKYVSDSDNPQMGAANTRFGSNIPPRRIRPDVENITPSARDAARLRWRRIDPETGKEITVPAMILNSLAAGWIQFNFHNFGGNALRDPIANNPHRLERSASEGWPENAALIDRTARDFTRVTDNGRPTILNERDQSWSQAQVYGSSREEQEQLRTFFGGKMKLVDGRLPEDPLKPGIDQTGFNNNFNPILSLLHWLAVREHNAICDYFQSFHPDWDDEHLFQMARKTNVAQLARIHTDQWTRDLLQHETLQIGMHADWYGMFGQPLKLFLMRQAEYRPWLDRLLQLLRNNDFLWGMPGSRWEHHDGPYQVPKQFRMVYRLHEMILSEYEVLDPQSGCLLERIPLLKFINDNTRAIVARHGYESLAWSFVSKSAGALTLHNFPRALTQFQNQQDGQLTDLAERDIFRERTDGTGSYNEFRESMGEPFVQSFLELTGGDAELARELEIKYEGDVDKVDAGIGILAEPKPAGFALGFTQFYQFVLNAPRRVKSNRLLSEGYTYREYEEGMNWVEHGGGMGGILTRHLPLLQPLTEGVERWFAPWRDIETYPRRLLADAERDSVRIFQSEAITLLLAGVASSVALATSALHHWWQVAGIVVTLALMQFGLVVARMLAMRFLQQCWKRCYTDKRWCMFGTLYRAERWIGRTFVFAKLETTVIFTGGIGLAMLFRHSHPVAAVFMVVAALISIPIWRLSKTFVRNVELLKISLRNRMRDGRGPFADLAPRSPNARGSFLVLNNRVRLQQYDEQRIPGDNPMGLRPGHLDMNEFDRTFAAYAPGRDHLTAYDFSRMREGNQRRDARERRGNWLSRRLRRSAARRRTQVLISYFADRVVEEDHKIVPAISRAELLRFYQGKAQRDLVLEHEEGDHDPSPAS